MILAPGLRLKVMSMIKRFVLGIRPLIEGNGALE
jgi:hypothetical protein